MAPAGYARTHARPPTWTYIQTHTLFDIFSDVTEERERSKWSYYMWHSSAVFRDNKAISDKKNFQKLLFRLVIKIAVEQVIVTRSCSLMANAPDCQKAPTRRSARSQRSIVWDSLLQVPDMSSFNIAEVNGHSLCYLGEQQLLWLSTDRSAPWIDTRLLDKPTPPTSPPNIERSFSPLTWGKDGVSGGLTGWHPCSARIHSS